MPFTNKDNPEIFKINLIEREQNLQFIDYCPRCDKWMEKEIMTYNNRDFIKNYLCKSCNTKRLPDEKIIINKN